MFYAALCWFVKGEVRLLMAPTPLYLHSEPVRVTAHLAGDGPHGEDERVGGTVPILSWGRAFLAGVNVPVRRHRPGESCCLRGLPPTLSSSPLRGHGQRDGPALLRPQISR